MRGGGAERKKETNRVLGLPLLLRPTVAALSLALLVLGVGAFTGISVALLDALYHRGAAESRAHELTQSNNDVENWQQSGRTTERIPKRKECS